MGGKDKSQHAKTGDQATEAQGAAPAPSDTANDERPEAAGDPAGDAPVNDAAAAPQGSEPETALSGEARASVAQDARPSGMCAGARELTASAFFIQAVLEQLAAGGVRIRKNGGEHEATADDLLSITLRGEATTIITRDGQKIQLERVAQ